MDSNGRFSYWCYRCSSFVRSDLGVCSECESRYVEEIEAPYPSTHTESPRVVFLSDTINWLSDDTNYTYRPKKRENHQRLILAIVLRGVDDGSGLLPCSSTMNDWFRESGYDRVPAQLALNERYGLCDHQRASKAVVEKTMPVTEIPRIILRELIIKDRSDSAIKKVFRNVFSFFRRNSSPAQSTSSRYWELVDSCGLHWQRLL
ncbi:hypothetical protein MKW98_026882 [Papaver atlanticum]|uniref:RING-type E3 ubiquitin transferase n=1 Tax=Papaver atlanticum TaxID=357466 RepID=A0AAD4S006_9MAGN|nr:hypothetical protein MKW98_026882 [Papaver atlanticum]